jgi:hypothetical protein
LAALLLPVLGRAKAAAGRTTCISNERQINLAVQLYVQEHAGFFSTTNPLAFAYKDSIKSYLGRDGDIRTDDTLFACPADNFNLGIIIGNWFVANGFPGPITGTGFCTQSFTHHSSYALNEGARRRPGSASAPAGTNVTVSSINYKAFDYVHDPAKTVLMGELSGCVGLSSHDRKERFQFQDARNVMSFVDGHVAYIRIHWNGREGPSGMPWFYEPPARYDYKWTGN